MGLSAGSAGRLSDAAKILVQEGAGTVAGAVLKLALIQRRDPVVALLAASYVADVEETADHAAAVASDASAFDAADVLAFAAAVFAFSAASYSVGAAGFCACHLKILVAEAKPDPDLCDLAPP